MSRLGDPRDRPPVWPVIGMLTVIGLAVVGAACIVFRLLADCECVL